MGAMAILRLALVFSTLTSLSILAGSSPSPSTELQIVTAERRIDLTSHIVKVFLTLKVENIGESPASEVLLAFSPTEVDRLAVVKAAAAAGKKKKKAYLPLDVKPTDLDDGPNGTKYYLIHLLKPLGKGEAISLEVLYVLTHSLEPFPVEISQLESQLVYYRDSAKILSPYPIKQQATFLKTPTSRVESFTRVVPTDRANTELRYGPYEEQPPYSYSPVIVHFENNKPFAVVEELVREIEISHWGSIQVTEHYKLVHAGARHKGAFSRVEYQSRPNSGVSSFKNLLAELPPRVHSVYYRDNIGNISSSRLRTNFKKSELLIEPRYPLFGGWKSTFVIGYGVPLEDFLFEAADGTRYLNYSFGCPLAETVVEKLTVKVVLPEGSKNPCRQGITSIDLVDEKWGKLEQPCSYKEGDLNVGVLGGDLSVLCNSYERTHSDVWVMKEYGVKESWTKLYTIRFPENYTLSPPLFMYNEGEILFVFESTFAIYNTKNDSITYREVTNVDDSIEAELCIESLVCPDLQNND